MKFFVALRIASYAAEFCKALGIDINEIVAKGDPAGFAKAQQAKMQPSADTAAVIAKVAGLEAENATLNAALESAKKEIEEAQVLTKAAQTAEQTALAVVDVVKKNATAFTGALVAAGLKCEVDLSATVDAAAVTSAATNAISVKGRELLAKHGLRDPIATAPNSDGTKPGASTKSATWEEYQAMDGTQKHSFFKAGGRLTSSPI